MVLPMQQKVTQQILILAQSDVFIVNAVVFCASFVEIVHPLEILYFYEKLKSDNIYSNNIYVNNIMYKQHVNIKKISILNILMVH